MKKIFLTAILAASLLAGTALAASKFNLSFSTVYMDKHPTVLTLFLPWAEKINKESNGSIAIQYFNPNTICPEPELFASTVAGIVDISGNGQNRNAGKFPLAGVVDLPFLTSNAEAGSMMSWKLYEDIPAMRKEMNEIVLLSSWASAPYQLHTVKKQVKSLEDLKGMKIIGWSAPVLDILKALGANPVQSAPTDTYLTLQRGGADGVLCPIAPLRSFKINEATKYTTVGKFFVTNFYLGINKATWDTIGKENQDIITKNSGMDFAIAAGKSLDIGAAEDMKSLTTEGHTFYDLPAEEHARWQAAINPLYDAWLKDMAAKGVTDAPAALEMAKKLGKEYAAVVAGK